MLEGPFAGRDSKHRFEREIALVGSLRRPGIVPIFDSGVAQLSGGVGIVTKTAPQEKSSWRLV